MASESETVLLPCPFCGGTALHRHAPTCNKDDVYDPSDRAFPVVRCGDCFAQACGRNWDESGRSAVEAWNRRTPSADEPKVSSEAKDASRYRWLRQHFRFANDSMHEIWFDASLEPNDSGVPEDLDQELDAAIGEQDKT